MFVLQFSSCVTILCMVFAARAELIDLTYELRNDTMIMPVWPNGTYHMEVTNTTVAQPNQIETITTYTAVGTHVQAPCRYLLGRQCVSDIPTDSLRGRMIVVDFPTDMNPDTPLTATNFTDWETKNGVIINEKSIVIINTGWGDKWNNVTAYIGSNTTNATNMHFPGLNLDAANMLINRKISGIGIDTLAIDYGQSNGNFSAQMAFSNASIYTILNVANVKNISGKNSQSWTLFVMPMKIKGAGAAPCRLFAVKNGSSSKSTVSIFIALCFATLAYLK